MSQVSTTKAFGAGVMVMAIFNLIMFGTMIEETLFAFCLQPAFLVIGYMLFRHQDRLLLRNFVL